MRVSLWEHDPAGSGGHPTETSKGFLLTFTLTASFRNSLEFFWFVNPGMLFCPFFEKAVHSFIFIFLMSPEEDVCIDFGEKEGERKLD